MTRAFAAIFAFLMIASAISCAPEAAPNGGEARSSRDISPVSPPESPRQAVGTAPASLDLHEVPAGERDTIVEIVESIDRGGPFSSAKDGTVFRNAEQALPRRQRGYYREYTVPTPGAHNRGARRIIQGDGGETFYTNDHYRTFVRIR